MNILTPTEISECLTGGPTTVARAIESEVIAKLGAGVSVEPSRVISNYPFEDTLTKYFTLSQLQAAVAAARVQENERCANACKQRHEKLVQEYPVASREAKACEATIRALLGKEAT